MVNNLATLDSYKNLKKECFNDFFGGGGNFQNFFPNCKSIEKWMGQADIRKENYSLYQL